MAQKLYRGWCPCPDRVELSSISDATRCSKGYAQLVKNSDREKVVLAIKHHLTDSPYHNMGEEEAQRLAEAAEIGEETADGDQPSGADVAAAEQPLVPQTKRPRLHSPQQAPRSSLSLELERAPVMTLPANTTVTMRSSEFQMVLDSIKRASLNVRNAERLCEAAAQSFRLEATALETVHAQLSCAVVHRGGGASSSSGL